MIHLSANTIVILNVYCKLTTMFQTNLTFYFFFFSIILSLPIYENYHAMFLNCFFHWLTIVYVKPGIVVCSCRKIIKICNWHICEKLIMKYLFMPSYICILSRKSMQERLSWRQWDKQSASQLPLQRFWRSYFFARFSSLALTFF